MRIFTSSYNAIFSLVIGLIGGAGCQKMTDESTSSILVKDQSLIIKELEPEKVRIVAARILEDVTPKLNQPGSAKREAVRSALMQSLYNRIADEGGIRRWQVRAILNLLTSGSMGPCGSQKCAEALGVDRGQIDDFIDEMRININKEPGKYGSVRGMVNAKMAVLESLEWPIRLKRQGPAQKVVDLVEPNLISAVKNHLKISSITYADLPKVTNLRYLPSQRLNCIGEPYFEELNPIILLMFPNLRSLTISIGSGQDMEELTKIAPLLDQLEIIKTPAYTPEQKFNPDKLKRLTNITTIRRLHIVPVDYPDEKYLDLMLSVMPNLEHLKISNFIFDKRTIQKISQMPRLRSLDIDRVSDRWLESWPAPIRKGISDIRITMDEFYNNCGDISKFFDIFPFANSMTLVGCKIKSLGMIRTPKDPKPKAINWTMLLLDKVQSIDGTKLQLRLPLELGNLLFFRSDSENVVLDANSQHDLAERLVHKVSK